MTVTCLLTEWVPYCTTNTQMALRVPLHMPLRPGVQPKLCPDRKGVVATDLRSEEVPKVSIWPLGSELEEKLPTMAVATLQRWAIFLLGYQYNFEFRPTKKHCNADGLSRPPRAGTVAEHEEVEFRVSACNLIQVKKLPLHAKDLQQASGLHTECSA